MLLFLLCVGSYLYLSFTYSPLFFPEISISFKSYIVQLKCSLNILKCHNICTFDVIATCFGHTWAIIRQHLLFGETTALYTLSSVTLRNVVVVDVVNLLHRISSSYPI
jgi:hypothetical protein